MSKRIAAAPTSIMIVEDENLVALDIAEGLQRLGYRVAGMVGTGREAVAMAEKTRPDLILMDINLRGDVSGIDAAHVIRDRLHTPVIYVTAYSDEVTLTQAKATEPFGYLIKPIDKRELHVLIEMALYRHRVERALRQSEEQLSTILSNIRDAVLATDADGQISFASAMTEQLLGRASGGLVGRPIDDVLQFVSTDGNAPGAPEPTDVPPVRWLVVAGGSRVPVEHTISPLRGPSGERTGDVHVLRDVSARLRAEEAQRRYIEQAAARSAVEREHARSRYLAQVGEMLGATLDHKEAMQAVARRTAAEVAHLCLIETVDEGGHLRCAGFALDAGFPVERADALRRAAEAASENRLPLDLQSRPRLVRDVAAATDPAAWDPAYRDLLLRGGLQSAICMPFQARGAWLGAITVARRSDAPPYEEEDVALVEELARRCAASTENATLFRLAREADRRKDAFMAMLGHELRNPLAPIQTALQLMSLRGDVGGERERLVIERQVKHLVRLVDDLLDINRVTQGKIQLSKQDLRLAEVVAKAVELVSPLLERNSHKLTISIPHTGVNVHGDLVRLAQVFANLLTNAAKYTEPGGDIRVAAECRGPNVVVSVKDDGTGIAPEMLSRIFELFMQGERTLDRAQGGLGLGLPLARSLVELHGGTITANSAGPGMGSEFIVTLPTAPGAERPMHERDEHAAARQPPRSGKRLLIVDDNRDAADMLAGALRALGHEVEVAYDGPHALQVAGRFLAQIAVLDIGLPVMDGYELAERLRSSWDIRLIAVTGYGQESDHARTSAAGFEMHFVKPIDLRTLAAAIEGRPADATDARRSSAD
ncbi:uncharacterized protein SOCE26_083570 [Sorangium cellulosum]|uniref:histidine kinase n=1 Tax=Sorangium cellulosum TaxID=56 RepID=A0A2L0F5I4_SORCE|nr:response regulator [Sorangium cellulosum]AUX46848.1 uncharacterized protein SOCE26_083570 [Sorangium cellulosum]